MTRKRIKLRGCEKVLLVRPDRLGDLILSLPVATILKRIYPEMVIHFLASYYNAQVFRFSPDVDGYIVLTEPDGQPVKLKKLIDVLEAESYNVALFLKPGWLSAFTAYMAGIPLRVGTLRRPYSLFFNVRENIKRKHSGMHEVDLNLMMLRPFGINMKPGTVFPVLKAGLTATENNMDLDTDRGYVVIHPVSKGSSPNWPMRSYLQLSTMLGERVTVVITGQQVSPPKLPEKLYNLINKTDFGQLVDIISRARLFISGSTGPLHLAAALGTPSLGIYPNHPYLGPHRWGPRGKNVAVLTPYKQNHHICRIKDNGSCDCMENIAVSTVFEEACRILATGAVSS